MALLELRSIRKRFGATVALDGVTLGIEQGKILALVGENGSGKSTLMRIVTGVLMPDDGEMRLNGELFSPSGPLDAQRVGISMIHQELAQCAHLSVGENIVLGREPRRLGMVDRARVRAISRAALSELDGADIDPDALCGSLPIDKRQIVELARAIATDARVVILDEPTSSLGKHEVERLFQVLDRLRDAGKAIVYISHFLEEIQRVADHIAVLRDGLLVATAESMTSEQIVSHMVGRTVEDIYPKSRRTRGDLVLRAENLSGRIKPISASIDVHRGEIVGIVGLNGSGRSEFLRAIFGLDRTASGSAKMNGKPTQGTPHGSWAQRIGMLSEDRKEEGLALSMSIADNVTLTALGRFGRMGLIDDKSQTAAATRWTDTLQVKCASTSQTIGELSGGNQQKAAIARMLFHDVDVLLLDEPTRGIDVGSKEQIYRLVDELAQSGKGVLLVSSYLPEVMGLCDRIHVMREGVLGPSHSIQDATAESLIQEATS